MKRNIGPSVSVIIPTMNRNKVLKHCIKSILLNTYKNIEIIITDDSDDDLSEKLAIQIKKIFNRIIYINSNAKNVSVAMNKGIKA